LEVKVDIAKIENIVESKIIEIRGQQVIVDSDVADLYGVTTKQVNQALNRNLDKFPKGYIIELLKDEKLELVTNCDRFANLRHSNVLPNAYTEKGLYMLATILKSPKATETTLAIIDTFTKVRQIKRGLMEVVRNPENEAEQKNIFDTAGELIGSLILPNDDDMEVVETESKHEFGIYFGYKYTKINRKRKKQ
jgi:hypothetical protein